jgi:uncharacterized protein involved in exopolysaccharide biosynthesis
MRGALSPEPRFDASGLRLISLLWTWRRFLVINLLLVMAATAVVSLFLPNIYRATASILPLSEESPMLSRGAVDLLVGLGPVGFASAGLPTSSSQQLAAVLRSRSMAEAVLVKENLIKHYGVDTLPKARREFMNNLAVTIDADGLVSVKLADKDPHKAASIVHSVLETLDSINQSLSTGAAAATRRFVDSRLADVEQELQTAEEALRSFQEQYGTIAIEDQLSVLIQNLALLRVDRMKEEMELAILEEQLSADNMRLRSVRQRIARLDRQIHAAESSGDSAISLTAGNAPRLAMQSLRLLRQVTAYDQLYQFLRKALEQARIEERRDVPTFSVLDPPIPPDRKWKPRRTFIMAGSGVTTLAILVLLIVWSEATQTGREHPPVNYRGGWRRLARRRPQPLEESVG